ncbi:hypothetical protein OVA29_14895 [Exiguobacterium sp. SL14]|nr:hypothetical protein [Exiguobacterium sp. SL14]MCY1691795.1 hypothetical protein [Exiguobacterium sp. SL14]
MKKISVIVFVVLVFIVPLIGLIRENGAGIRVLKRRLARPSQ